MATGSLRFVIVDFAHSATQDHGEGHSENLDDTDAQDATVDVRTHFFHGGLQLSETTLSEKFHFYSLVILKFTYI